MVRQPGATQDEMRRHNVSTLLRQVHVNGAVSRAELTSLMGLNRSTIKALVEDLEHVGLVTEEIPDTRLGGGRPSHVVVPRQDTAYVLAGNIGVDAVTVAAVGLGGRVWTRREYRITGLGAKPEVVAGRLASEFRRLIDRVPAGTAQLSGVGLGVPGVVRRSDGHIQHAPNMGWRNVPFGELLAERLSLPVPLRLGNDGDLGALAEHVRGVGRGVDNLLYLSGEVGIGGGIIVDGRLVNGAGGYAGEFGHMIVNPMGHPCRCGSRGCFETEVGEDALLVACGRAPGGGRRALREVLDAALGGEQRALEGVSHVAGWLARGLASLINVFNPELVILGGPVSAAFRLTEEMLARELTRLAMPAARQQVRIVVPGLGDDSSLLGAAELAFEALLQDPVDDTWRR